MCKKRDVLHQGHEFVLLSEYVVYIKMKKSWNFEKCCECENEIECESSSIDKWIVL